MKLIFEQSADDIVDLSKHSLKSNRFLKYFGIFFIVVIGINFLGIAFTQVVTLEKLLSWFLPIIIIVVIWIIIVKVFVKKGILNSGNKEMMIGEREVELLDDKIKYSTPVSETVYQWKAITELGQSDKNYFMYLGKRQAIIIPRNAFGSDSEKTEFEKLVHSKIEINKRK